MSSDVFLTGFQYSSSCISRYHGWVVLNITSLAPRGDVVRGHIGNPVFPVSQPGSPSANTCQLGLGSAHGFSVSAFLTCSKHSVLHATRVKCWGHISCFLGFALPVHLHVPFSLGFGCSKSQEVRGLRACGSVPGGGGATHSPLNQLAASHPTTQYPL